MFLPIFTLLLNQKRRGGFLQLKYKFKLKHLLYVFLLLTAIVAVLFTTNQIKFKSLLDNNQHFEAWQLTYDKPYYFVLSENAKDERIQFFNTMATHVSPESLDAFDSEWTLPDFTGWSCAEIACALKNINQAYEVRFIEDYTMQHNLVVKHEPAAGDTASKDEKIILYANSAYTSESTAAFYKYTDLVIAECGEWVYFTAGNDAPCIYRTHIDFSDIEVIYNLNSENDTSFFALIAKENYVYFQEQISYDKHELKKINSDGSDEITLMEREKGAFLLKIYMDKFYTSHYVLDLKTNEIELFDTTSPFKWLFTSFNNQSYYYENIKDDATDTYTGNIYLFSINEMIHYSEPILKIDGKINQLKADEVNLYISYSSPNDEEVIIAYDLDKQIKYPLANVYNRGLSSISLDSVIVFRDSFYVIGNDIFDYKYDTISKERERITIATMSDYTYNETNSSIICGNYLIDTTYFIHTGNMYNMATFEYEHNQNLEQSKDY